MNELQQLADKLANLKGSMKIIDTAKLPHYWATEIPKSLEPECIQYPEAYYGGSVLSIKCTQTNLSAAKQKQLVNKWCEILPTLKEIEWLWIYGKTPQKLFEAACQLSKLKSLFIKWSSINNIEKLSQCKVLSAFHLGSVVKVPSFSVLNKLSKLEWLSLHSLNELNEMSAIASLSGLKGLAITGKESKRLKVKSFDNLSQLKNLEWLHLGAVMPEDESLDGLKKLTKLESLIIANYYSVEVLAELSKFHGPEVCHWLQPFVKFHPSVFPCQKCDNYKVSCSGKGGRLLCPSCDSLKLAKHVMKFENFIIK